MVLSEVGDCGTTFMRFLCSDAGGSHENRQLNNFCPTWIMDIVCQVRQALLNVAWPQGNCGLLPSGFKC